MLSFDLPMGGLASLAPVNALRAGFFLTDKVSIEPSVGFSLFDDDEETMSHFGFATSLLLQPFADANRAMPFLGLGGNYNLFDFGEESGTDSQFGVQGFAGARLPVVSNLAFA